MGAVLLGALGVVIAVGAHLGCKVAESRAQRTYKDLVGDEAETEAPDDSWKGVRPLIGGWGCLLPLLEFLRGLGILLALGAGLYLITR